MIIISSDFFSLFEARERISRGKSCIRCWVLLLPFCSLFAAPSAGLLLGTVDSVSASQEPVKAIGKPRENVERSLPEWVSDSLERANRFASMDRCEDAIPILERVVRDYPRVTAAVEILSNCYLKTGKSADAARILEEALEKEPGRFQYLRALGLAYLDLGRKKEAVEVWRRALVPSEEYGHIYGLVAKLEQEAGLYEEAINTYREGAAFDAYRDNYTRELIRLEKLLGRHDRALRDFLKVLTGKEELGDADVSAVLSIYKEAGNRSKLLAMVDSAARAAGERSAPLRAMQAVLLLEEGRLGEARAKIFARGSPALSAKGLFVVAKTIAMASTEHRSQEYEEALADVARKFRELYSDRALFPAVLLTIAEGYLDRESFGSLKTKKDVLEKALSLAKEAQEHRAGNPYAERAAIFRARVLLEYLHRADDALRELDSMSLVAANRSPALEELRTRALVASSDWDAAQRRLSALAADPDSSFSIIGKCGLGELAFRRGSYSEASKILSELAEKHPENALANDALERAMDIASAMREGVAVLDLYRSAVIALDRGEMEKAFDALTELETKFERSTLAAKAIFLRAEVAREQGLEESAASDFERICDRYPGHELSPRALEELARMKERNNPEQSRAIYETLIERYSGYPFIERIRARYAALSKLEGIGQKKGIE